IIRGRNYRYLDKLHFCGLMDQGGRIGHAKFLQQVATMAFHGQWTDEHLFADFCGGMPLRHQGEYLALALACIKTTMRILFLLLISRDIKILIIRMTWSKTG